MSNDDLNVLFHIFCGFFKYRYLYKIQNQLSTNYDHISISK